MHRKKPKDKPIEVILEYDPKPDAEERLNEIFEFLLSGKDKYQKNTLKS